MDKGWVSVVLKREASGDTVVSVQFLFTEKHHYCCEKKKVAKMRPVGDFKGCCWLDLCQLAASPELVIYLSGLCKRECRRLCVSGWERQIEGGRERWIKERERGRKIRLREKIKIWYLCFCFLLILKNLFLLYIQLGNSNWIMCHDSEANWNSEWECLRASKHVVWYNCVIGFLEVTQFLCVLVNTLIEGEWRRRDCRGERLNGETDGEV